MPLFAGRSTLTFSRSGYRQAVLSLYESPGHCLFVGGLSDRSKILTSPTAKLAHPQYNEACDSPDNCRSRRGPIVTHGRGVVESGYQFHPERASARSKLRG